MNYPRYYPFKVCAKFHLCANDPIIIICKKFANQMCDMLFEFFLSNDRNNFLSTFMKFHVNNGDVGDDYDESDSKYNNSELLASGRTIKGDRGVDIRKKTLGQRPVTCTENPSETEGCNRTLGMNPEPMKKPGRMEHLLFNLVDRIAKTV